MINQEYDMEVKMIDTVEQLKKNFGEFLTEYEKFVEKGNKTAGTRARKALLEVGKLTKTVRGEIQEAKNAG